jgi:hypothetical protein
VVIESDLLKARETAEQQHDASAQAGGRGDGKREYGQGDSLAGADSQRGQQYDGARLTQTHAV